MNTEYISYDDSQKPVREKLRDHGVARDLLDLVLELEDDGAADKSYRLARLEDRITDASDKRILRIVQESDPWRIPGWPDEASDEWALVDHAAWFELHNVDADDPETVSLTSVGREAARIDGWRDPPVQSPGAVESATEVSAGAD